MSTNKIALGQAGTVQPLVDLLSHQGLPAVSVKAAEAIFNLTKMNQDNRALVARHGAVPQLMKLLEGTSVQQEWAAKVLWHLAYVSTTQAELRSNGTARRRLEALADLPDNNLSYAAMGALRQIGYPQA